MMFVNAWSLVNVLSRSVVESLQFCSFSTTHAAAQGIVIKRESDCLRLVLLLVEVVQLGGALFEYLLPRKLFFAGLSGKSTRSRRVQVNPNQHVWMVGGEIGRYGVTPVAALRSVFRVAENAGHELSQSLAVVRGPIGLPLGFEENPKPGSEGITKSKSSDSFGIASRNSNTQPGQPCVRINGLGFCPRPRT